MLLLASNGCLSLLPACPERFESGKVDNWHFPGGRVSFRWNRPDKELWVRIWVDKPLSLRITFPEWADKSQEVIKISDEVTIGL